MQSDGRILWTVPANRSSAKAPPRREGLPSAGLRWPREVPTVPAPPPLPRDLAACARVLVDPRREPPPEEPAPLDGGRGADARRTAPPSAPRGRVLVVDDELVLVCLYARTLSRGHEITVATDGLSAARLTAEIGFDVIVSDVVMPGLDGFQLLRWARKHDPDVAVLLLTGDAKPHDAACAAMSGALLYLAKPIDPAALRRAVDHALEVRLAAKDPAGLRARALVSTRDAL
jgi:CheY-like chemotaxis protein